MPALKDVGDMMSLLGETVLAKSPLWNKPVELVHPMQPQGFKTRLTLEGHPEEAESIVETVLTQLHFACTAD